MEKNVTCVFRKEDGRCGFTFHDNVGQELGKTLLCNRATHAAVVRAYEALGPDDRYYADLDARFKATGVHENENVYPPSAHKGFLRWQFPREGVEDAWTRRRELSDRQIEQELREDIEQGGEKMGF